MIYKQDVIRILKKEISNAEHEERVANSYGDREAGNTLRAIEETLDHVLSEVEKIEDEPDFMDPEEYQDMKYDPDTGEWV